MDDPAAFHERYLERLAGVPGIESASITCVAPLSGHCVITRLREAGARTWAEARRPSIGVNFVSDDFFRTLRMPVLQVRTFTSEDQRDSRPVVVISQRAAQEVFPDGGALGQTLAMGVDLTPEDGGAAKIIGVVGDILFDRPVNGVMAEAFVAHRQEAGSGTAIARVRGEPLSVFTGARVALAERDPDVPLFGVQTMRDLEAGVASDTRVLGWLLSAFAAFALLLACTGVCSVVAWAVANRSREIGVRVALGAEPERLVRAVLGQGLRLGVAGVAAGTLGAWAGGRLLRSVLFGVGPQDPVTFLAASVVLLGVAALAAWVPARRAARVDPMVVLRAE